MIDCSRPGLPSDGEPGVAHSGGYDRATLWCNQSVVRNRTENKGLVLRVAQGRCLGCTVDCVPPLFHLSTRSVRAIAVRLILHATAQGALFWATIVAPAQYFPKVSRTLRKLPSILRRGGAGEVARARLMGCCGWKLRGARIDASAVSISSEVAAV